MQKFGHSESVERTIRNLGSGPEQCGLYPYRFHAMVEKSAIDSLIFLLKKRLKKRALFDRFMELM
jgi:hypothetical protein